jgi:hypothetical protein
VELWERLALPRPGDAAPAVDSISNASADFLNAIEELLPHVTADVRSQATRDPRVRNLVVTAATLTAVFVAGLVSYEMLRALTPSELLEDGIEKFTLRQSSILQSFDQLVDELGPVIASDDALFATYNHLQYAVDNDEVLNTALPKELHRRALLASPGETDAELRNLTDYVEALSAFEDHVAGLVAGVSVRLASLDGNVSNLESIAQRFDRERRAEEQAAAAAAARRAREAEAARKRELAAQKAADERARKEAEARAQQEQLQRLAAEMRGAWQTKKSLGWTYNGNYHKGFLQTSTIVLGTPSQGSSFDIGSCEGTMGKAKGELAGERLNVEFKLSLKRGKRHCPRRSVLQFLPQSDNRARVRWLDERGRELVSTTFERAS